MRIVNDGFASDGTPYYGEWYPLLLCFLYVYLAPFLIFFLVRDIFLYSNNEQDASVFNETALGCNVVPYTAVNMTIPPQYSVFISYNDREEG
jgi:hypothetical protein